MTNPRTIVAEPGTQSIAFSREFEAPAALVFEAHVDADLVAQWIGPKGTRAGDARVRRPDRRRLELHRRRRDRAVGVPRLVPRGHLAEPDRPDVAVRRRAAPADPRGVHLRRPPGRPQPHRWPVGLPHDRRTGTRSSATSTPAGMTTSSGWTSCWPGRRSPRDRRSTSGAAECDDRRHDDTDHRRRVPRHPGAGPACRDGTDPRPPSGPPPRTPTRSSPTRCPASRRTASSSCLVRRVQVALQPVPGERRGRQGARRRDRAVPRRQRHDPVQGLRARSRSTSFGGSSRSACARTTPARRADGR